MSGFQTQMTKQMGHAHVRFLFQMMNRESLQSSKAHDKLLKMTRDKNFMDKFVYHLLSSLKIISVQNEVLVLIYLVIFSGIILSFYVVTCYVEKLA